MFTDQAKRLLERATRLPGAVQDPPGNTPDARTGRRAHELRQTVAVLLILCEGLARETGNDPMVELEARTDGTGRASFTA